MDHPPTLPASAMTKEDYRASAPDRSCGDCTVCCVSLNIDTPELRKPPGVPCPHLGAKGCGIYETRPPVCREWYCLWRDSSFLLDSIRPDRSGVLFSVQFMASDPLGPRYIDVKALRSPDDLQQSGVRYALARLIVARVMPIWLSYNGTRHRLFPDSDLTDAIFNPQTTEHRHLLPLAEELRLKWGLPSDGP